MSRKQDVWFGFAVFLAVEIYLLVAADPGGPLTSRLLTNEAATWPGPHADLRVILIVQFNRSNSILFNFILFQSFYSIIWKEETIISLLHGTFWSSIFMAIWEHDHVTLSLPFFKFFLLGIVLLVASRRRDWVWGSLSDHSNKSVYVKGNGTGKLG